MKRHAHGGFTLVELLVVVAIISLLIAVLLPAIGRARDVARLSACGSNLRGLGVAASAHAAERKGWFPQTMRSNPLSVHGGYGYLRFWRIGGVDPEDNRFFGGDYSYFQWQRGSHPGYEKLQTAWKHYGTPWEIWHDQLGVQRELLICPSSEAEGLGEVSDNPGSPGVKAAYAWLSGAQHTFNSPNPYPNTTGMGQRVPALTVNEKRLMEKPLAADIVQLGRRPWGAWPNADEVNHGLVPYVDAQNILFADGHVANETAYYAGRQLDELQHQYNRWWSGDPLMLWYWGQGE